MTLLAGLFPRKWKPSPQDKAILEYAERVYKEHQPGPNSFDLCSKGCGVKLCKQAQWALGEMMSTGRHLRLPPKSDGEINADDRPKHR